MGIMGSSSSNKTLIYDPFRKEWVKETPEEKIRQQWLKTMVEELGFPTSLIAVEKELKLLPHLLNFSSKDIPRRRIDVVVFAKEIFHHSLFPLLLLECKAMSLSSTFTRQVISYNESVRAPFIAIANKEQILIGQYNNEEGMYHFTEGLPSYDQLLKRLPLLITSTRDDDKLNCR